MPEASPRGYPGHLRFPPVSDSPGSSWAGGCGECPTEAGGSGDVPGPRRCGRSGAAGAGQLLLRHRPRYRPRCRPPGRCHPPPRPVSPPPAITSRAGVALPSAGCHPLSRCHPFPRTGVALLGPVPPPPAGAARPGRASRLRARVRPPSNPVPTGPAVSAPPTAGGATWATVGGVTVPLGPQPPAGGRQKESPGTSPAPQAPCPPAPRLPVWDGAICPVPGAICPQQRCLLCPGVPNTHREKGWAVSPWGDTSSNPLQTPLQ